MYSRTICASAFLYAYDIYKACHQHSRKQCILLQINTSYIYTYIHTSRGLIAGLCDGFPFNVMGLGQQCRSKVWNVYYYLLF